MGRAKDSRSVLTILREEDENQTPDREDDVHQGELKWKGEEVDEGHGRNPHHPVRQQEGNESLQEALSLQGLLEAACGMVVLAEEIEEEHLRGGQQGAPEELIDEGFENDGRRFEVASKHGRLEFVELVHLPTMDGPKEKEEGHAAEGLFLFRR